MSVEGYVHGRTDDREVARLEKQGDWTAAFTFPAFDAAPGMRVLDLATGVGAMAARLTAHFPGLELSCVDLSAEQLGAARRNHPGLALARGDATRLPFRSAAFDRVHCSWLLEHVVDPLAVLREARRVLRPGGVAQFVEVDNGTLRSAPELPAVAAVLARLNEAQRRAGGDPFIGPQVGALMRQAGFAPVESWPVHLEGTQRDPAFLRRFVDEFAEIFEGLDEALGDPSLLGEAAEQLRGLLALPQARLTYTAHLARGTAPPA